MTPIRYTAALDVACPTCGAEIGMLCADVKSHRGRFHHDRVGAAVRATREANREARKP